MALSLSDCEAVVTELAAALTGGWIQKIHQPRPMTVTCEIRVPSETFLLLICVEPQVARLHLSWQKDPHPPSPPSFCQFLRANLEGGRIEQIIQEPGDRVVYVTISAHGNQYILTIALTGHQANAYLLNDQRVILQSLRASRFQPGEHYVVPSGTQKPIPVTPRLFSVNHRFPVSFTIEHTFRQQEEDLARAAVVQKQKSQTQKALRQTQKKIVALQEAFTNAERYQGYARYGELLKGALGTMTKGQASVTVVDYYDPLLPELTLPLNPSKDPVENMKDYFRKYQKYIGTQQHLRPRLAEAKQQASHLQETLQALEKGEVQPNLDRQPSQRPKASHSPPQGTSLPRTSTATGYRQFVSFDGLLILVGKNAKENDHLTLKVAKPDDLWLHARGTAGSHVVVQLEKNTPVPQETLKDAATLALWYSDLRKSGKGEVIYTPRKFVKKSKGQKPGAVLVTREKSVWIACDADRLERLKDRS